MGALDTSTCSGVANLSSAFGTPRQKLQIRSVLWIRISVTVVRIPFLKSFFSIEGRCKHTGTPVYFWLTWGRCKHKKHTSLADRHSYSYSPKHTEKDNHRGRYESVFSLIFIFSPNSRTRMF